MKIAIKQIPWLRVFLGIVMMPIWLPLKIGELIFLLLFMICYIPEFITRVVSYIFTGKFND
jgi:hypothetical protein